MKYPALLFILSLQHATGENITILGGVYTDEVPGVLIYEGVVELNWEFNLPVLSVLPPIPPGCTDDVPNNADRHVCDLLGAINSSYGLLKSEFLNQFPFLRKETSNPRRGLLPFLGEGFKWIYGLATEGDVKAVRENVELINSRVEQIKTQGLADHEALVAVIRDTNSYSTMVQSTMASYANTLAKNLSMAFVKQTEIIDLLTYALHNSLQFSQLTHAATMADSVSIECRLGLVPLSLIGQVRLATEIANLNKKVFKDGYKVAGNIISLLDKKISKCIFTHEHLYVTLAIPVRKIDATYSVLKLTPIHFKYHGEVCVVHNPPKYLLRSGSGVTPISKEFHAECNIEETHTCKIPTLDVPNIFAPCANALASNSLESIRNDCTLQCAATSEKFKTWISDTQLIVTNYDSVHVTCIDGMASYAPTANSIGAVCVEVPCGCSVGVDSEIIPKRFPCMGAAPSGKPLLSSIVPVHWILNEVSNFSEVFNATGLNAIFNPNWKLNLPNLNVTPPVTVEFKEFTSKLPIVGSIVVNENYMIVWLIVLSAAVLYIVLAPCIAQCRRGGFSLNPMSYIPFLQVPSAASSPAPGTDKAWYQDVWSTILNLEYFEIAGYIVLLLILILVLRICFKIMFFIRKIARDGTAIYGLDSVDEDVLQPRHHLQRSSR